MFKKYIDVERLGKEEVLGLFEGVLYCFPKLDGANGSIWVETEQVNDSYGVNYKLCCGSRNMELDSSRTNQGFYPFVQVNKEKYLKVLKDNPSWILYGEWLVPHTVKSYRADMWNRFWVFDVYDTNLDRFLTYSEYSFQLLSNSIDTIVPVAVVTNATVEVTMADNIFTEALRFGCNPGELGEGMVLKNYAYKNRYGHVTWGKIVRQEFKEEHRKSKGIPQITGPRQDEQDFVGCFLTRGRIEKLLAKLQELDRKQKIPRFLETIYYELIQEELWGFIRKNRRVMDFSKLRALVILKAKQMTPELFGFPSVQISNSQEPCKTEEESKSLELSLQQGQ